MNKGHGIGFSRRRLLQALLATAATPGLAGAPLVSERPPRGRGPVPPPAAEALVDKAKLTGEVVFAVSDAETGDLIEERGPRLLLRKYLVKTGLLEAIEELGELLDLSIHPGVEAARERARLSPPIEGSDRYGCDAPHAVGRCEPRAPS